MPLIRCDYSPKLIEPNVLTNLVKLLLEQSITTFHSSNDAVSIFTKPYDAADHSTSAAEVEVRAKAAEFDDSSRSRSEVRQEFIMQYQARLKSFWNEHQILAPLIFTITLEDWEVAVITAK